jgi:hypothetical protein
MFRESLIREIEHLRRSDVYRTYQRVREEVLSMKERQHASSDDGATPSTYWQDELRSLDYLFDAPPFVVAKLRQHSYHITGIWAYHYRAGKAAARQRHIEQLEALHELGCRELFVPESRILGGFGFETESGLVNADTLKFYEALIALKKAEVLETLEGHEKTVVEIGGGWGGFAYQVKTLFPDVRYVIVDLPELFLYSAVYLITAFPEAKVAFWQEADSDLQEIVAANFIFASNTDYESLPLARVDLAANMVSFQEMTTRQVENYIEWLYELGVRALYSLNRDRGAYNPELTSVREVLGRWFWLRGISVLPWPYNIGVEKKPAAREVAKTEKRKLRESLRDHPSEERDQYRHVVGRPKLLL